MGRRRVRPALLPTWLPANPPQRPVRTLDLSGDPKNGTKIGVRGFLALMRALGTCEAGGVRVIRLRDAMTHERTAPIGALLGLGSQHCLLELSLTAALVEAADLPIIAQQCPRLQRLDLTRCLLGVLPPGSLRLPALRALVLASNYIGVKTAQELGNDALARLETLDISGCLFSSLPPLPPRLRELRVAANHWMQLDPPLALPELRVLDMRDIRFRGLLSLAGCPRLRELHASGNDRLYTLDAQGLAGLEVLDLAGARAMTQLPDLAAMPELGSLDVRECGGVRGVADQLAELLESQEALAGLEELRVSVRSGALVEACAVAGVELSSSDDGMG